MKKLIVVRHAKAEEPQFEKPDFVRNLALKGQKDAHKMAEILSQKISPPAYWLISAANRTTETSSIFQSYFDCYEAVIQYEKDCYLASSETWKEWICATDDQFDSMIIFGHNPGITDLIHELVPTFNDFVPTCGIGVITISSWQNIFTEKGELIYFDFPKKHT